MTYIAPYLVHRSVLQSHARPLQHDQREPQVDCAGWRRGPHVDRVPQHCHGRQQGEH